MWDLPGPGLKPMSPALAGGFLTTAPPGSPVHLLKGLRKADQKLRAKGTEARTRGSQRGGKEYS